MYLLWYCNASGVGTLLLQLREGLHSRDRQVHNNRPRQRTPSRTRSCWACLGANRSPPADARSRSAASAASSTQKQSHNKDYALLFMSPTAKAYLNPFYRWQRTDIFGPAPAQHLSIAALLTGSKGSHLNNLVLFLIAKINLHAQDNRKLSINFLVPGKRMIFKH